MAKIKEEDRRRIILKEEEIKKALEKKKEETFTKKDFEDILNTVFKDGDTLPLNIFQRLKLRIMMRGKIFNPVMILLLRLNKGAEFYVYNLPKDADVIVINKCIYKITPDRVFGLRRQFKNRIPLVVIKEWDVLPLSTDEITPERQKREVESLILQITKRGKPLVNINRILIILGVIALGVAAYILYMKLMGRPPT